MVSTSRVSRADQLPDAEYLRGLVTAEQLSERVGGLIGPRAIMWRARTGKLAGVHRVGDRWYFDADQAVQHLVVTPKPRQINANGPPPPTKVSRPPRNTFDAPGRVRRIS